MIILSKLILFNFKEPNYTHFDTSRSLVAANISVDYKELDEQIMTMMEKRERGVDLQNVW